MSDRSSRRSRRATSPRRRPAAALLAAVLGGAALFHGVPAPAAEAQGIDSFVTRSGEELLLDGHPYRFSGANIYNANSDGWCGFQYTDGELAAAFGAIGPEAVDATTHPDGAVVRAWFFQSQAASKSAGSAHLWSGARDWTRLDRTLAIAREKGVRVIVTLENQWDECGDGPESGYKTDVWYGGPLVGGVRDAAQAGYKLADPVESAVPWQPGPLHKPGDPDHGFDHWVAYRDWVQEVVARYRDHPEILAWQLINEGEAKASGGSCPADAAAIMTAWADDVSTVIRDLDPEHLISLGTIGTGQCGAGSTATYKDLHAPTNIDLCEVHDYETSKTMPGDAFNGLQPALARCHELAKPVFVGEIGIYPADAGGTTQGRADRLQVKIAAQSDAGAVGHLAWIYNQQAPAALIDCQTAGVATSCFDIAPGDPALLVLAKARVLPPWAPGDIAAVPGDAQAQVSWSAPASDGGSSIMGYTISTSPGGATTAAGPSATNVAVTGLANGTTYTFTVKAVNAAGPGPASAPSNAVIPLEPMTLSIRGVVDIVDGLDSTIMVGDPFSIVYTFDPAVPDRWDPVGYGIYDAVAAAIVTVGSYSATGNVGTIYITNDVQNNLQIQDGYHAQFFDLAGQAVDGLLPDYAQIELQDYAGSGSSVPSEALPSGPLDVSAFPVRFLFMEFIDPACSSGPPGPFDECPRGFVNATVETWTVPTIPGSPGPVTAGAGDGTVSVAWVPPSNDGGGPITGYDVVSAPPGSSTTTNGSASGVTLTGLTNGIAYTVTVSAKNAVGTGPGSASVPVTPIAGAPPAQTTTEIFSSAGGTVATDPTGTMPTESNPVVTAVTVPPSVGGGTVTIAETALSETPPSGYAFLAGQQVLISSTAATTVLQPLTIVFTFDPTLPAIIFRNGVPIDTACDPAGTATPSPCLAATSPGQITILTAQASTWVVGMRRYDFTGFFSPVDNQPVVNVAKAGSTIPVKFALDGDRGLAIFAKGYPKSQAVACDSHDPIDALEETAAPGAAGLSFDAVSGQYQYVWKAEKAWTGKCRLLTLKFIDGTTKQATFKIK